MSDYRSSDVPVRGGTLHVVQWGPTHPDAPVVLAVHGITGNAFNWANVAGRLDGVRVIAVDLAGRGHSAAVPGPYSMRRHAEDLATVLEHLGVRRALMTGHSMGAFVAVVFGHLYPGMTTGRVLIDGGLPVLKASRMSGRDVAAFLGPAAERLAMTFPDLESYRQFWRAHPALGPYWTPGLEQSLGMEHDLVRHGGALRSRVRIEALHADVRSMRGPTMGQALMALPFASNVTFLRAPRGLLDEARPLYPLPVTWFHQMVALRMRMHTVASSNHYTIVLGDDGARQVAAVLQRRLGLAADDRAVRTARSLPVTLPRLDAVRRALK